MGIYSRTIFLLLCCCLPATASVVKITSLNELPLTHSEGSVVFFDIDDTLLDFPCMLGSKAWRKEMFQVAPDQHDRIVLFITKHIPATSVEPMTTQLIKELQGKVNIYFHLADSVGKMYKGHDCVNIGKGIVDFKKLSSVINFGIIETLSKDESIGKEIIQDYYNFAKIKKTEFDRIIMPLPKDASKFLKSAFYVTKKGTIINFYTFAKEGKFKDAEKRLLNSCKKLKQKINIINTIKCGQVAPREFRICIDFKVG